MIVYLQTNKLQFFFVNCCEISILFKNLGFFFKSDLKVWKNLIYIAVKTYSVEISKYLKTENLNLLKIRKEFY